MIIICLQTSYIEPNFIVYDIIFKMKSHLKRKRKLKSSEKGNSTMLIDVGDIQLLDKVKTGKDL